MQRNFLSVLFVILLLNSPCWAGVDFDGVDDNINCGDVSFTDNLTSWSLSFWIKWETLEASDRIFDKWQTSGQRQLFVGSGSASDEIIVAVRHPTLANYSIYVTTNANMTTGVWYHVVVTWLSHSSWTVYLDGTSLSLTVDQTSGTSIDTGTSSTQLFLSNPTTNGGSYGDFILDEVYFWGGVVLSTHEVSLLGSKVKGIGRQIQSSSLKFYTPLDEQPDGTSGDGDIFLDRIALVNCTGSDGANNTGLTAKAEEILSYP